MPENHAAVSQSSFSGAASFDHFTNGVKNSAHVFVVVALMIGFISGWLQRATASALDVLQEHGVAKIEGKDFKLELRAVKAEKEVALNNIQNLVNNPSALNTVPWQNSKPQDGPPNTTVATALASIDEPGSSWVYIGQFRNAKYLRHPNFEAQGLPNANDDLTAWTDTYRRSALPIKTGPDNWKLGEIVGVVKAGQKVHVRRVERIEDDNYWLQIVNIPT
jgi:hypothetical protein